MKNNMRLTAVLLGAVVFCAPLMAAKPKKAAKTEAAAPAMDPAMMEKWKAFATPGDAHKALSPLVGSFNVSMKCWMAPGTPAEESTGASDAQWILGGRFVETVFKGTSMGQPFEGRGLVGYDNEKKQYDGVWLDSMSTGMMTSHGQYDAAAKTFNESGSSSCPFEGTKSFRMVTKVVDDNNHSFEMYTNDKDGKEFLMMVINYVRKS